jgi:CRP/FNR family transcriptional regulator, cyclic AMP receptor protein
MSANTRPLMTLEALRSVPLFASLNDEGATGLRELLELELKSAGSTIFEQGDEGDAMYLIEDGRIRIFINDEEGDEVTLAELAGGDFFGEMAILDGKPRSAHASVLSDARLAVLSRDHFLSFVRQNPDVALTMLGAITKRLRETDEMLRQRVTRNLNEMDKERLTMADRMADAVSEFGGSWAFIFATVAFVVYWVVYNTVWKHDQGIDPFPYSFLDVMNGIVAALLTPIILISQNRQSEKDRLRSDLDFQINLKNELSLTEVMRRLDVLESERLPLLFAEQNASLREQLGGGKK